MVSLVECVGVVVGGGCVVGGAVGLFLCDGVEGMRWRSLGASYGGV